MPEALLVANAPLLWTPALAALASEAEPLLAANGGANRLAAIGLKPSAVIGDLDSIEDRTRRWVGAERLVERVDQDRTDLDKAIEYAFSELALPRLTVIGAVGRRIDHALGNLGLLARHGRGEDLRFLGAEELLVGVRGEAGLEAKEGETWSFWTFDPSVRVTLAGVRWPVRRERLDVAGGPSISNVATSDRVIVVAEGGSVVVMRRLGEDRLPATHHRSRTATPRTARRVPVTPAKVGRRRSTTASRTRLKTGVVARRTAATAAGARLIPAIARSMAT